MLEVAPYGYDPYPDSPIIRHTDKNRASLHRQLCPSARQYQPPSLNLSGKWLKEVGFDTGTGVTVKIAGGCIVLIPGNDEMKALREEIKQAVKAVKEGD